MIAFLILPLLWQVSFCARILVSSVDITPSQTLLLGRVADLLAKDGHEVTFFHSITIKDAPELPKPKLAKDMSFLLIDNPTFAEDLGQFESDMWETEDSPGLLGAPVGLWHRMYSEFCNGCEQLMTNKKIMDELKKSNFDIAIIHTYDMCMFGIAEAIGIKATVYFSTFFMIEPLPWYTGTPAPASHVPSTALVETDKMDFFTRMYNLASVSACYIREFALSRCLTNRFRKHFGPNFPHIDNLLKEVQLTFINSDPFFEYPRPTLHNVIYVGGLTMKSSKPHTLNAEWQKIVNESLPNGIVLFSLGTLVDTKIMPVKVKNALFGAFGRFSKHTIICRFEGEIEKKPPNVKIVTWMPQKDLLYEPKVKLFITHGGYNSLTEATFVGVPMVAMPMFFDQAGNAKRVERLKVGKIIERSSLTDENKIYQSMNEVLTGEDYLNNARRLAKMIRNKPVSSLDLFLKWIKFLAEFKNLDSLKPESRNMGIIQYFMIDVLAFLFALFFLFIWLTFKCCKRICSARKDKTKKE